MASERITVRVPDRLTRKLRELSAATGRSESEVIRAALENHLADSRSGSAFDIAERNGFVGCVERAPKDLSTNRSHFDGFGKNKK